MDASTAFNGDEDDGEVLTLPHDTITALQDFYHERDQRQQQFDNLKAQVHQNSEIPLSMEVFSENWNASQFWYNDETATILAKQLLEGAAPSMQIAVVSAPSVFIQLKNLITSGNYGHPRIALLEFDERFNVFSDFIHYDFNCPLKLPPDFKGAFDRILCDPPFLSADCQTKAAMTIRWLLRPNSTLSNDIGPSTRTIVCTGQTMEKLIMKLYPGVRATTYEPRHNQDRLSNQFRTFANYECDDWKWR